MKAIKMFYIRLFKVITNEKAIEYGLTHFQNIYGDGINYLNCRSIWKDSKGRKYRVSSLVLP